MSTIPNHLAIIMDGNGRWARARGHGRHYGHVRGAQTAKKIIQFCAEQGLKHLTLFAFSTENWFRPPGEISFLMSLMHRQLHRERENLVKNNMCFRCVGDKSRLQPTLRKLIEETEETTKHNTGMTLVFALSYSGRQEIRHGFEKILKLVESGHLKASDINDKLISESLESSFLPDPDLIIRTSGETRISNFFLWQAAYSEIYFIEKCWPDFCYEDILSSFRRFSQSERRYGEVSASPAELTPPTELTFPKEQAPPAESISKDHLRQPPPFLASSFVR